MNSEAVDERTNGKFNYFKTISIHAPKEEKDEIVNTFAAIVDRSRFNNSCLRLLKIGDDSNE
jgi:hypothetical protein